jgi:hypothetical protein
MPGQKAEILGAVVLIAASGGLLLAAIPYPADSRIFPMMTLGGLLVAGLIWLFRLIFIHREVSSDDTAEKNSDYRRLLGAALVTTAYGVAVWQTSYFIPTVLYIPLMAYILGSRALSWTIPASLAYTTMIYLIFVVIFERPMPLY